MNKQIRVLLLISGAMIAPINVSAGVINNLKLLGTRTINAAQPYVSPFVNVIKPFLPSMPQGYGLVGEANAALLNGKKTARILARVKDSTGSYRTVKLALNSEGLGLGCELSATAGVALMFGKDMTYETLMAGSEIALSLSTHTMKNYRLKTTVREYVVGQQEPEFVAYSAASSTGWDSSNGGWSSDCSRGHVKDVTKWNNPLRELCQKGGRMTILRLKQNGKDLDGCIVLFNCGFGVGVGKGLPFQMIYQGTLTPLS